MLLFCTLMNSLFCVVMNKRKLFFLLKTCNVTSDNTCKHLSVYTLLVNPLFYMWIIISNS